MFATAGVGLLTAALLGAPLTTDAGVLQAELPGARVTMGAGDLPTRVYGRPLAFGGSAEASAEAFRTTWSDVWGVPVDELVPVGPFEDGRHVQPIMPDLATGAYRFTGLYYSQQRGGLRVYGARLLLLVRNEAGFPLVMASSTLRALGDFDARAERAQLRDISGRVDALIGPGAEISEVETVIFAGVDGVAHAPVLATHLVAERGGPVGPFKTRYVLDATTGAALHSENLICSADLIGTVTGIATEGDNAAECDPEAAEPMPYARVLVDGAEVFADVNGYFMVPDAGSDPVTVDGEVRGRWFNVNNQGGSDATESVTVTPGDADADLLFNPSNDDELVRAEVNAYVEANVVRDFALLYSPAFPVIADEEAFPVRVNIDNNCNAYYNGTSINFYTAGGNCNNTAFTDVVHHEYGHHMVRVGGSGQGEYGEGMSDCMGVLITDDPKLAVGFFAGNCSNGLRNADNNCQYQVSECSSCGGAIHACGQLISGCVWDLRQELAITEPDDARAIAAALTVNSILLHDGTSINPLITIDFLVLDDDDGWLDNGTPHYDEIAAAFGAHGMDAPSVSYVQWSLPQGIPNLIPTAGATFDVSVTGVVETPIAGSGMIHIDTGGGFVAQPMVEIEPNVYEATLPGGVCGDEVRCYLSVETVEGGVRTLPTVVPPVGLRSIVGAAITDRFVDTFQSQKAWVISNGGGLTSGAWERAIPPPSDPAAPDIDVDATDYAMLTGGDADGVDVDGGSTSFTSPLFPAGDITHVYYSTWLSNDTGDNPSEDVMTVEVSGDGGVTWQLAETIGPGGARAAGGWFRSVIHLDAVAGFEHTGDFRVRFTVADTGGDSTVEAAIDAVRLAEVVCTDPCPGDVTGDQQVDVADILALIAEFGPCGPDCPLDIDGSGSVDVPDLLIMLGGWVRVHDFDGLTEPFVPPFV